MDVLILRLIHVSAGAFWVGAVFTFFLFVQPTAVAIGPDATKFTYHLLHNKRLPAVILGSAVITVVAGIWLLVIASNGLDPDALFDVSRLGFTVGGLIAILTLGVGADHRAARGGAAAADPGGGSAPGAHGAGVAGCRVDRDRRPGARRDRHGDRALLGRHPLRRHRSLTRSS